MSDKTLTLVDPATGTYIPILLKDTGGGSWSPQIAALLEASAITIGNVKTNATRNAAVIHRSAITAIDKVATAILAASLTQTATTGGSLVSGTTYFWAVVPGNKYGVSGIPSSGTYIGTGTPGASNTVIILAFAQVTGAEYYDVFLSVDAAPKLVGRITEAQRAAGVTITTASTGTAACVTAAGTAGKVNINVVGTGQQTSAAVYATNNALTPEAVAAVGYVNCAGYSVAHIKVAVSVADLFSAPQCTIVPFLLNDSDTFYDQAAAQPVNLLTATGQALRQDFALQVDGSSGLVVCIGALAGALASCTVVVQLA